MKLTYWISALLLTLGVGHFAARADSADAEPGPTPLTRQESGAQAACGPGFAAVWADAVSHECFKESP